MSPPDKEGCCIDMKGSELAGSPGPVDAALIGIGERDGEREAVIIKNRMPWSGCLVSFMVHRSALERCPDLSIHPKLPKDWELYCATPMGVNYAKIEFVVEGEVKREDGLTVKGIMDELGII